MKSPAISKQSLGTGYVVATGVTLSLALLAHAATTLGLTPVNVLVLGAGLLPALSLAGAHVWLPKSGLDGEQIWTVAEWCGLGVAVLTLVTIASYLPGVSGPPTTPTLLASSVAMGGFGGILVGALLELRRSHRRLDESSDVLVRVLRHDLRNELTVALGHLGELERTVDGDSERHAERLRESIDRLIATTDKAAKIDLARSADQRTQRPVDVVPYVREAARTARQADPDARVDVDLPEEAVVYADWMVATVVENIVENAVEHCEGDLRLHVTVACHATAVELQFVDNCEGIPPAELDVLDNREETPLRHSKGVGLWVITWIVEGYGGSVTFDADDDGNTVTVTLPAAGRLDGLRYIERR
ncbi:ATP-binding protein [Haloarcula marina]|uniref:ATP-binding protein n=1 Tax=Haloarcula marina TaxID=2961574 RepID=UPI0020B7FA3E|nr:ATP-binding protein [Halomicroarcula marina]